MGKFETAGSVNSFPEPLEQPPVELPVAELPEGIKAEEKSKDLKKRAKFIRSMVKRYRDDPVVLKEDAQYMKNSLDNPTDDSAQDDSAKDSLIFTDDAIKDYLNKADQYRTLSNDELKMLFEKIDNGAALKGQVTAADPLSGENLEAILDMVAARQVVLSANLKLVGKLANQYYKGNDMPLPLVDIFMAGTEGLADGIDRFDVSKGFTLSTYVWRWMDLNISRAIANESRPIRIPPRAQREFDNFEKALTELKSNLGRTPTDEEGLEYLKAELDIKDNRYSLYKQIKRTSVISLDTPVGDGDTSVGEQLSDPTESAFDDLIDTLSDNQDALRLLGQAGLNSYQMIVVAARLGFSPSALGELTMKSRLDDSQTISYQDVHKQVIMSNGDQTSFRVIGEALEGRTGEAVRQTYVGAEKMLREAADDQAA